MLEILSNLFRGRLLLTRTIMILAALGLISIGLATIYAAGHPAGTEPSARFSGFFNRQLLFAVVGLLALAVASSFSYRLLGPVSALIYGFVLILLAVLLVDIFIDLPFVPVRNFARRWIDIGPVQFQPSEFCKLAYIVALAWYLRYRSNCRNFRALIGPFVFTLIPVVLIVLEPDLGTAVLLMPVLFAMLFIAGARGRHLLLVIFMAVLSTPLLWHFMGDYQRMRVSSLVLQSEWLREKAIESPRLGQVLAGGSHRLHTWQQDKGYHLLRSKYAIGSGGTTGFGYRNGPFIKYNFLPERHNDFIFALIAHQWGLAGGAITLSLYAIIMACGLKIARYNPDPFGRLIVIGILSMFAVQVLVNIGMTIGLMPVTGLTLPLISYGGSSLVVNMTAIGLLNNVGRTRPFNLRSEAFRYEEINPTL